MDPLKPSIDIDHLNGSLTMTSVTLGHFLVLAEQYGDSPDDLQCHQVLYEPDAPHHIGTQRIGSDSLETEALFWAG